MDVYEILSLLFLGGIFLIALLAYIDSRINKRNKISLPCTLPVLVGLSLTYGRLAALWAAASFLYLTLTYFPADFKHFLPQSNIPGLHLFHRRTIFPDNTWTAPGQHPAFRRAISPSNTWTAPGKHPAFRKAIYPKATPGIPQDNIRPAQCPPAAYPFRSCSFRIFPSISSFTGSYTSP